jgi:cell division transport system permease protein
MLERFTNLGRAVSAVLVLSGMFIIYATIRLTFMGRQEEREILRLIGAQGWFIRGPFLVQGTVLGLVAGGVSLALLQGLQVWLLSLPLGRSGTGPLWFLGQIRVVDPSLVLVLLGAGALAGLAGSWLALGRVMGKDK